MLTDDGFCTSCRHWVLEYPGLPCPWCNDAAAGLAADMANLDESAPIAEQLRAAAALVETLGRQMRSATALRRHLAGKALVEDDLYAVARAVGVLPRRLERWAIPPEELKCANGHARKDHADRVDGRWICRTCKAMPRKRVDRPKLDPSQKRAKANMRAQWKAHEERLRRRRELAERDPDAIPGRLREPLPPPGRPPGTTRCASDDGQSE